MFEPPNPILLRASVASVTSVRRLSSFHVFLALDALVFTAGLSWTATIPIPCCLRDLCAMPSSFQRVSHTRRLVFTAGLSDAAMPNPPPWPP